MNDDIPLLEHLTMLLEERDRRYEQRFTDLERTTTVALTASEKAILKAENAVERRFDSVNEFRQTLSDQASQFITRTEAKADTDRNTERIQEVTDRINVREGRGNGLNAGWAYLGGSIGLIATIISIFLAITR